MVMVLDVLLRLLLCSGMFVVVMFVVFVIFFSVMEFVDRCSVLSVLERSWGSRMFLVLMLSCWFVGRLSFLIMMEWMMFGSIVCVMSFVVIMSRVSMMMMISMI